MIINTNDFGILKRYVNPAKGYKFHLPAAEGRTGEESRPSEACLVQGVHRNVG